MREATAKHARVLRGRIARRECETQHERHSTDSAHRLIASGRDLYILAARSTTRTSVRRYGVDIDDRPVRIAGLLVLFDACHRAVRPRLRTAAPRTSSESRFSARSTA